MRFKLRDSALPRAVPLSLKVYRKKGRVAQAHMCAPKRLYSPKAVNAASVLASWICKCKFKKHLRLDL